VRLKLQLALALGTIALALLRGAPSSRIVYSTWPGRTWRVTILAIGSPRFQWNGDLRHHLLNWSKFTWDFSTFCRPDRGTADA